MQLHLSFGVRVLLRVIWQWVNIQPSEDPGTPVEHKSAKIGHYLLYAIMIAMPVTGYIDTGVATEFFFLFDIAKFPDTWVFINFIEQGMGINFLDFERPFDFIHKQILGVWLAWMLISGHIFASLYLHFVKKDRTSKKTTFDD